MSLANLALDAGRRDVGTASEPADIITFIEASWGLGMRLYPVQRVILKAHYGLELDDNPLGFPLDAPVPLDHPNYDEELIDRDGYYSLRVPISDWKRENKKVFTEAGDLRHLYDSGSSNDREVIQGVERREMMLSLGRRSGKTGLGDCIGADEG